MGTFFCFTSTGNSLFAAKKLAAKTGCEVKPMNGDDVQTGDDVVGFVFPTYFWGLPRMVARFVSALQITNKNAYVFGVATCGGAAASGMLGQLEALLKKKGVRLHYGARIVSVTNYLPEYTPKDSEELRQKIDENIDEIASAINSRQTNNVKPFGLFNKIAYSLYPKQNSDKHFTVDPACTGCTTCAKVCPAGNITMQAGEPCFLHKCEHCLACVHHCPVQAIDWKGKTQGKPRYKNAGVSLEELIKFNNNQT